MNDLEEEIEEIPEEEELELYELSEEETQMLFSTVLDETGTLSLNKVYTKPIPKKEKDKYYFAGTITGYEDKFDRPVYFVEGAHEEALPYWNEKKLFTFHNDKQYPLGKFEEAFMDGPNVKILGWTDDRELYDNIKAKKMTEMSGRIVPKKVIYNRKKKKFGIVKYRPKEGSMVNFQGYEPAKVEILGTNKNKVRDLLMKKKDEAILLQSKENEIKLSEETQPEQKFEEKDKKILELERELKVMKFKEEHPDATNIDKVIEFMLKYEVSEDDAKDMLTVEEAEKIIKEPQAVKIEVIEEEGKLSKTRENKELPRVAEAVSEPPKEKTAEEKFRETLDERVEHAFRRGYK